MIPSILGNPILLKNIGAIILMVILVAGLFFTFYRFFPGLITKKSKRTLLILAPLMALYLGLKYGVTPSWPTSMHEFLLNLTLIGIITALVRFLNQMLDGFLSDYTQRYESKSALIRTMHQLIKISIGLGYFVSVISLLMNRSPMVILSSLGALTAIFLLVFKDSILGFVASIQVTLLGIVREGDWIEMPKYGADGDILDINISSIRVQNFDKTITTIPTHALVTEGVKNWRGMAMANARRIKRSVFIDINKIEFCDESLINQLKKHPVFASFASKHGPVLNAASPVTNMGLFRLYLRDYLNHHPDISNNQTVLVREGQSCEAGVPLELYCFTNTTNWSAYEAIQSDIFDHVYASVPFFGLCVIQYYGSPIPS